jgi:hypothetical protein
MTIPATPLFFWSDSGVYTQCSKESQLALALHFLTGNDRVADLMDQGHSIDTLISMVLAAAERNSEGRRWLKLHQAAVTGVIPALP